MYATTVLSVRTEIVPVGYRDRRCTRTGARYIMFLPDRPYTYTYYLNVTKYEVYGYYTPSTVLPVRTWIHNIIYTCIQYTRTTYTR